MPLLIETESRTNPLGSGSVDLRPKQVDAPGFTDTAMAGLRQESDIVSAFASKMRGVDIEASEDGFTGAQMWDRIKDTPYADRWESFVDVRNGAGFQAVKAQIDMEDEDNRTLAAAGGWGIAARIGGSLVSPTMFIPGGAVFRGAKTGGTILKTALATGAATGVAIGLQEAALHSSQETRELDVTGIGAGVLFGSLIGAGAGALFSRAERRAALAALESSQKADWDKPVDDAISELNEGIRASLSAGATKADTLDDLTIAGGKAVQGVVKTTGQLNPLLRALQSPNIETRRAASMLMDNPVYLRKNLDGDGDIAAETAMQQYTRGSVAQALEAQRLAFGEARKTGLEMRDRDFREAVGKAMRRGDHSEIPAVAAAARAWRQYVFEPLKNEAIRLGLLPKDVSPKTAISYLTRVYNRALIVAEQDKFKGVIRGWIRSGVDAEFRRNPGSFAEFVNEADLAAYVDDIVEDVYRNVTGQAGKDAPLPKDLVITRRGPLAERTLNIPDRDIERYLEDDIELIGTKYARVMAADVEITRQFGDPAMQGQMSAIREEYARLRKQTKDAEALTRLHEREKADIRDIQAVRDILRGHYLPDRQHTDFARITRAAMQFNYMRALGGLLISNIGDAFRPAVVNGMNRFLGEALVPMMTNLKAVKLSAKEGKLAGAVTERSLQSRIATLAELTDPYSHGTPFERFMTNAANVFTRMTLINEFTDFNKTVASVLTQNRMLRNARQAADKGFDSLPKAERAYMGFLGIGKGYAEDLGKAFARHGEDLDGVLVAHTDEWADELAGLRRAYYAALNKDVDRTIVTPGVGDVPLSAHDPIGKAFYQFRTFTLAANQRMLINGLQEGGGKFAMGMVPLVTAGMMVYWLKQVEAGREISDDPKVWIAEGLDRSGLFALAFEINSVAEKSLNLPGIYHMAGAKDGASRFQSRDTLGGLFPIVEMGQSAGKALGMLGADVTDTLTGEGGEISDAQLRGIRRLTPFASMPYWRWWIDGYALPNKKN
ncbi:MAG: hypothetical protein WBA44_11660 [Mesorhizobium sp.]